MNGWSHVPVQIEFRPEQYGRGFSRGFVGENGLAFYDTTGGHLSLVRLQQGTGPLIAVTVEQERAWRNLSLVAIPVYRIK